MGELDIQGIESHLSMSEIEQSVYALSKATNGSYAKLHDDFGIPPGVDIELVISLLESCTFLKAADYDETCNELRELFRRYLISQIAKKKVKPDISSSLLHMHIEYGNDMGESGEKLIGILTTNYDSLLENAYQSIYGAINCGRPFYSNVYSNNTDLPSLLKLHGSFNWRVVRKGILQKQTLEINREFEETSVPDGSGLWVPPSVYKKPEGFLKKMWNQAADLLVQCHTLRVIGSSLRNEDAAILSLIFTSRIRRQSSGAGMFNIELIVPDDVAVGGDDRPNAIMQRLRLMGEMQNYSKLPVYPTGFTSTGNVYKEWVEMKIKEIERNKGVALSDDKLLSDGLHWEV